MRLIDGDALEKSLEKLWNVHDDQDFANKDVWREIENAPTAESERKKGKWEVQPSAGDDRPFIWWKCSECGHVIFSETERDRREFHAFCGRCGADMRGE